jgi:hypothetical protein
MSKPILGTEAISTGTLTRGSLRWNYSRLHPGVYLPKNAQPTLYIRTTAAWLWTDRQAVVAGRAAAALHGAKWVDAGVPIELLAKRGRRPASPVAAMRRHATGQAQLALPLRTRDAATEPDTSSAVRATSR